MTGIEWERLFYLRRFWVDDAAKIEGAATRNDVLDLFAHIDAQDQRIQELEAALGEARYYWWSWVGSGVGGAGSESSPEHQLRARIDALLAPVPSWPSISKGVT